MATFKVNDNITVECRSENTRSGFRHLADLFYDGRDVETVKCTYLNRTWEAYEFQSVLYKLAEKSRVLTKEEKEVVKAFAKDGKNSQDSGFGAIGAIMALGDLFSDNQSEANDWKTRMLKAGLEGRGLIMPDDWDTLDENEKTRRLDGISNILASKEV